MLPAHLPSAAVLQEGADNRDPAQLPLELTRRSQATASQLRVSLGALPFVPSELPSPEEELLLQKERPGSLRQGLDSHHPQHPLHIGTPAARAMENQRPAVKFPFAASTSAVRERCQDHHTAVRVQLGRQPKLRASSSRTAHDAC